MKISRQKFRMMTLHVYSASIVKPSFAVPRGNRKILYHFVYVLLIVCNVNEKYLIYNVQSGQIFMYSFTESPFRPAMASPKIWLFFFFFFLNPRKVKKTATEMSKTIVAIKRNTGSLYILGDLCSSARSRHVKTKHTCHLSLKISKHVNTAIQLVFR